MKINSFTKWPLFIVSIILMGIWFPVAFFRKDEQVFFKDNFGLNTKLGANEGDSVEDAWESLATAPLKKLPHQLKNILHEWTRELPKRAAKFLSFVIVVQALVIIWLV